MRALTVRQPWAWAIIHGGKNVENRTRNLAGTYRGPVAIHAGLVEDEAAYDDEMIKDALGRYDDSWLLEEQIGRAGSFIGVVDLVDAHRCSALNVTREILCCQSPWAQQPYDERHGGRRVPDLWHLELANRRPLATPIPARGRLGLWTPAFDVLEQLQAVV
jgi:hypothetical protein